MGKTVADIGAAVAAILFLLPIVFWLVPSPEFENYAFVGLVLGALLGATTHGYLGHDVVPKAFARIWPPISWVFACLVFWAVYEFGWKEEILRATSTNEILVGMAVLILGVLTSFAAALFISVLIDKFWAK